MSETFSLVTLASGAKSLRSLDLSETFHPKIGPTKEASILHCEQQRLLERGQSWQVLVIWDVGLGAAANACAALQTLGGCLAKVQIHSFDRSLDALRFSLDHADEIPYLKPYAQAIGELIEKGSVQVNDSISWHFHLGDFRETMQNPRIPRATNVIYDPYSPKGNPEMWTLPHFQALYPRLAQHALWTNYSRSTAVRVGLLLSGFYVGIGRGIGQKNETTIASNSLEQLERPLTKDWLKRVLISGNAAPLRGPDYSLQPISDEDFQKLSAHPQFRGLEN